jgi:hypothetical protein
MEVSRHWRLKAQRYRLEGSACPTCGQVNFPPRRVCPHCAGQPVWIAGLELSVLPAPVRTIDFVSLKVTRSLRATQLESDIS